MGAEDPTIMVHLPWVLGAEGPTRGPFAQFPPQIIGVTAAAGRARGPLRPAASEPPRGVQGRPGAAAELATRTSSAPPLKEEEEMVVVWELPSPGSCSSPGPYRLLESELLLEGAVEGCGRLTPPLASAGPPDIVRVRHL